MNFEKGGMTLNMDRLKGFFMLWVIILMLEVGWLFFATKIPHKNSIGDLIFIVTIIVVTLGIGSVGLKIFGKPIEFLEHNSNIKEEKKSSFVKFLENDLDNDK